MRPGAGWLAVAASALVAVVAIGAPVLALSVTQTNASANGESARPNATVFVEPLGVSPSRVVVRAGQTVRFDIVSGDQPRPGAPHQISGAGFTCQVMTSGSCSHRYDQPGTFTFTDALSHGGASGVILVQPG